MTTICEALVKHKEMLVPLNTVVIHKAPALPVATGDAPRVGTFSVPAKARPAVKIVGPRVDIAETEPADFFETQGQPLDWDEEHEDEF